MAIYRSVEWCSDRETGEPIPAGTLWTRNEKDLFQKFEWKVVEEEDRS